MDIAEKFFKKDIFKENFRAIFQKDSNFVILFPEARVNRLVDLPTEDFEFMGYPGELYKKIENENEFNRELDLEIAYRLTKNTKVNQKFDDLGINDLQLKLVESNVKIKENVSKVKNLPKEIGNFLIKVSKYNTERLIYYCPHNFSFYYLNINELILLGEYNEEMNLSRFPLMSGPCDDLDCEKCW